MNIPEICYKTLQKSILRLPGVGARSLWLLGRRKGPPGDLLRKAFFRALLLGLMFATPALAANHRAANKHPPVIIFQDNQDIGPAIVPDGGGKSIEYRKVLSRGKSMIIFLRSV